jgi:hypothetical protein
VVDDQLPTVSAERREVGRCRRHELDRGLLVVARGREDLRRVAVEVEIEHELEGIGGGDRRRDEDEREGTGAERRVERGVERDLRAPERPAAERPDRARIADSRIPREVAVEGLAARIASAAEDLRKRPDLAGVETARVLRSGAPERLGVEATPGEIVDDAVGEPVAGVASAKDRRCEARGRRRRR